MARNARWSVLRRAYLPAASAATTLVRRTVGPQYRASRSAIARFVFERGGLETSGVVPLDKLGLDHPDRTWYEPSKWLSFYRTLRGVKIGPDDVFVDFGSGKGRMVYMVARRYRLKRVVGIEIAEELNRQARDNIGRVRDRLRTSDVELVTCDATEFPIPDDMTVAYFYNPFVGESFKQVLANIIDSLDRAPRRLVLIYANPQMEEYLTQTGRFTLQRVSTGLRADLITRRVAVYVSEARGR